MSEESPDNKGGMPKSLIIKLVAIKLVIIGAVVGAVWYML